MNRVRACGPSWRSGHRAGFRRTCSRDSFEEGCRMTSFTVAQWATGNIGARSLRQVIEHPDLELVGVYVHSSEKAGSDAGDLCGVVATGIVATNDIDELIAARPDCVLYMPQQCDFDEVCRLLAAGVNIV